MTPLARLQAAVARWPHWFKYEGYILGHDPAGSAQHDPEECAYVGGRCALADADLAAVVEGHRLRVIPPRKPFIAEYMMEDPEEARDG